MVRNSYRASVLIGRSRPNENLLTAIAVIRTDNLPFTGTSARELLRRVLHAASPHRFLTLSGEQSISRLCQAEPSAIPVVNRR